MRSEGEGEGEGEGERQARIALDMKKSARSSTARREDGEAQRQHAA